MKKRFQTNQRIVLSGLAFHFAIACLLCSATIAQQIAPNPNPDGNTIFITGPADNSQNFINYGTIDIDNDGWINSWGTLNNQGTIDNNLGTLTNGGTFENYATFNNQDYFMNWMFFSNSGTLNNDGYIGNDDTINNSGTIFNNGMIDNPGHINNLVGGIINNSGTLNNTNGITTNWGTINNSANFWNEWVINNHGTINNDGFIDNFEDFDNQGTLNINNTGIFWNDGYLNNTGTINNSGILADFASGLNNQGTLKGTGTFIGDLINDSGTVAPGNSPGTMTIDGDFTLDDFGILDIEIGGFTPGTFDILDITGTAYMPGGNINFSFLNGYDIITDIGPYQSMELTFLSAGYIDNFSSLINYNFTSLPYFQFDVLQRGNELVFEATNLVPLPGAVLLGGIGLAFASWKLRRRKEL